MAAIDLFVHPDFHNLNNWAFQKYLLGIEKQMRLSELPILLTPEKGGSRFEKNKINESIMFFKTKGDCGSLVIEEDFERYIKLIESVYNQGKEIRIHGEYLEQCVQMNAIQLYLYLHCDKLKLGEEKNYDDYSVLNLVKDERDKGKFKQTRIRYGVVHRSPTPTSDCLPNNKYGLPFGGIQYQLKDNKTKIFNYPRKAIKEAGSWGSLFTGMDVEDPYIDFSF